MAKTYEEVRAELERAGFKEIDEGPRNPDLRKGVRVRNQGEQYAEAMRDGTATVLAVMRRGEDGAPDSWEKSWGHPNVEVIVQRDEEKFEGTGLIGQWSDYGTVVITDWSGKVFEEAN